MPCPCPSGNLTLPPAQLPVPPRQPAARRWSGAGCTSFRYMNAATELPGGHLTFGTYWLAGYAEHAESRPGSHKVGVVVRTQTILVPGHVFEIKF